MPSTGYKWLDVLIAFLVFLIVVYVILEVAEMVFDDDDPVAMVDTYYAADDPTHTGWRIG